MTLCIKVSKKGTNEDKRNCLISINRTPRTEN